MLKLNFDNKEQIQALLDKQHGLRKLLGALSLRRRSWTYKMDRRFSWTTSEHIFC